MDTSSVIIGLVTLTIFVLPIVLLHTARRKKEKKQRTEFDLYAQSKGVHLDRMELWSHYSIGIDGNHGRLFYVKQHLDENAEYNLNLDELESCETKRDMMVPKITRRDEDPVLDALYLMLNFRDKQRTPLKLEFYSRETSNGLSNELELLEKWNKRITAAINF